MGSWVEREEGGRDVFEVRAGGMKRPLGGGGKRVVYDSHKISSIQLT